MRTIRLTYDMPSDLTIEILLDLESNEFVWEGRSPLGSQMVPLIHQVGQLALRTVKQIAPRHTEI